MESVVKWKFMKLQQKPFPASPPNPSMTAKNTQSAEETVGKARELIEQIEKHPDWNVILFTQTIKGIAKSYKQLYEENEAMKKNSRLDNRLKYFKDCCVMYEALGECWWYSDFPDQVMITSRKALDQISDYPLL